uniref:RT_RNaseH domain-containing protein n=1 Tax=Strongyloides venezuelensis TaxID=75913 RepID=A0A0K0FJ96_STRVS
MEVSPIIDSSGEDAISGKAQFQLITDASRVGIAGVLLQKQDGALKIVGMYNRTLRGSEVNYPPTDLKALALCTSLEHYHVLLYNNRIHCLTDHIAKDKKVDTTALEILRNCVVETQWNWETFPSVDKWIDLQYEDEDLGKIINQLKTENVEMNLGIKDKELGENGLLNSYKSCPLKFKANMLRYEMQDNILSANATPGNVIGHVLAESSNEVLAYMPKPTSLARSLRNERLSNHLPNPVNKIFEISKNYADFLLFDTCAKNRNCILAFENSDLLFKFSQPQLLEMYLALLNSLEKDMACQRLRLVNSWKNRLKVKKKYVPLHAALASVVEKYEETEKN